VLTVSFNISNIVDDINDASDQAEKDSPQDCDQHCIKICQFAIKDQRCKDEDIFSPLFWSHCFEDGSQHSGMIA